MISGARFLENGPMFVFAALLWALAVWRLLVFVGRRRLHQRPHEFVARKVEENDRVILENKIRRHPEYSGVEHQDDGLHGSPLFDHGDGAHVVDPRGCSRCADVVGSLRAG